MKKFSGSESKEYHGHPRFYELLDQMAELHSRKNHDYAGDDPLSNLRAPEEIGIPAWKGILIRLMDKWGRLKTFANTGNFEVKDEGVNDTLMDNAVYSLLCIIVLDEAKESRDPMEDILWGKPGDDANEKTPHGIKYWVTKAAAVAKAACIDPGNKDVMYGLPPVAEAACEEGCEGLPSDISEAAGTLEDDTEDDI